MGMRIMALALTPQDQQDPPGHGFLGSPMVNAEVIDRQGKREDRQEWPFCTPRARAPEGPGPIQGSPLKETLAICTTMPDILGKVEQNVPAFSIDYFP